MRKRNGNRGNKQSFTTAMPAMHIVIADTTGKTLTSVMLPSHVGAEVVSLVPGSDGKTLVLTLRKAPKEPPVEEPPTKREPVPDWQRFEVRL